MEITEKINRTNAAASDMADAFAYATESSRDLNASLQEHKAIQRRRFYRIVVYTMLVIMAVAVWFLKISTGCKVGIDLALLITAWLIWGLDHAKEINQDLLLSPDELIMQKKLEERDS